MAAGIDRAHDENTSILSYNDENSLSCVLSIAYYYARNEYIMHRELPTGKGFADIVFIPRRHINKPTIVIELKYNKNSALPLHKLSQSNIPTCSKTIAAKYCW